LNALISFLQHNGYGTAFKDEFMVFEAYVNFCVEQLWRIDNRLDRDQIKKLLQALAFELLKDDSFYFKRSHLEKRIIQVCEENDVDHHFLKDAIIDNALLYTRQNNWFSPVNRRLSIYLAADHISILSRKEKVDLYSLSNSTLLSIENRNYLTTWWFLYYRDQQDFIEHFLLVHLKNAFPKKGRNKTQDPFIALLKYSKIVLNCRPMDLHHNVIRIEKFTAGNFLFLQVLSFLKIKIDLTLLKDYVEGKYSAITDQAYYNMLAADIKKIKKYNYYTRNEVPLIYSELQLNDYLEQTGFLDAMKKTGFYDYVVNIYNDIVQKIEALTAQHANLSASPPEKH
jgi:hypothetical protein